MEKKSADATAYEFLKIPAVKKFIDNHMAKIEQELGVTFEAKIKKLWRVVNAYVPDNDLDLDTKIAKDCLGAISELNKMQGHYSAEKIVQTNLNTDADIETVKATMDELLEKHKKDY